jgi:hypothetical protein
MIGTGLPTLSSVAPSATAPQPMGFGSMGGATVQSVSSMQAQAQAQARAQDLAVSAEQSQPVIAGLAGHVKAFFERAKTARQDVQIKMIEALYARRGQYTADKLAKISSAGQPAIFMMLPSVKMRQAESLLRDAMQGAGTEKPWTLKHSPVVELPADAVKAIFDSVTAEVEQAIQGGLEPTIEDIRQRLIAGKTQITERVNDEAAVRMKRMEDKMEDQLVEGGFPSAFDQFISDLVTFKTAFLAGPIIRNRATLTWGPDGQPVASKALKLEWERVDPFDMYPAPWARHISEGPVIRRHRLTREKLNAMIGVEGYSDASIRKVLDLYGTGGLTDWLDIDSMRARAEGKLTVDTTFNTGTIDALQYWGSVSGQMLIDWGMPRARVPEPTKEYEVETWVIGPYVIKAVLNADPLARRPYYADSYERIPGSVWGNSLYDLMRDCSDMCNASARAMAANLGIASGPMADVNIDRLAPGADGTNMYPWKIWQTTSDPMNSTQPAIKFFQPSSNAAELMGVYQKFADLADEYTGIPKYTVGAESAGGAGRTASGMSMMLGNASKIIKAIVSGVDVNIFTPMLERLYYYNMRYGTDPDLKGDINVIARGAQSLAVKDMQVQLRNQLLATTNNPTDMQIIGLEGRAELLRGAVSGLGDNTSAVVPPVAVLKDRQKIVQQQQAQAAAAGNGPEAAVPPGSQQAAQGPAPTAGPGQALMAPGGGAGAPITDNFQPQPQSGG